MKTNKKLLKVIAVFMLLIPFRLLISVGLIVLFTKISTMGININKDILAANVVVTKVVYDIILAVIFIYNVEMLSIDIKKRKAHKSEVSDTPIYWWTTVLIFCMIAYIIFDGVQSYQIFNQIY